MPRPSSSQPNSCSSIGRVIPPSSSVSQSLSKRTGECSVCHVAGHLNKDGTIHQHGPRNDRCQGSNKPPAIVCPQSPQPGPITQDTADSSCSGTRQLSQSSSSSFAHPQCAGRVLKHIPRTVRPHCADQLTTAINRVLVIISDLAAWRTLLDFTQLMLLAPFRAGRRHNVANTLKKRRIDADGSSAASTSGVWIPPRSIRDETATLAAAVRAKIEDGNIRAAARILCSEEKPAAEDAATLDALRKRHPQAPSDYSNPPDSAQYSAIRVTRPMYPGQFVLSPPDHLEVPMDFVHSTLWT